MNSPTPTVDKLVPQYSTNELMEIAPHTRTLQNRLFTVSGFPINKRQNLIAALSKLAQNLLAELAKNNALIGSHSSRVNDLMGLIFRIHIANEARSNFINEISIDMIDVLLYMVDYRNFPVLLTNFGPSIKNQKNPITMFTCCFVSENLEILQSEISQYLIATGQARPN